MDTNTDLSAQTKSFLDECERGLSIKDSLPDTAQRMALCTAKTTNDLVEAVAQIVQRDAVIVALQQGKRVLIDFSSGDTPITAESLQQAREELNSSGYSLLVGKVSEYSCKLLVGKHSPLSRRQSRLLWLAPSTARLVTATTWERAWRNLFRVNPQVDTQNKRIDRKSKAKLSDSRGANLLTEAEKKEAAKKEAEEQARQWSADYSARQRERMQRLAEREEKEQQRIADRSAKKKAQIQLLAEQELRNAAGREERDNEILLRFDLLQRGDLSYTQPWALSRNADGRYSLNPNFVCRSKRIDTFELAVLRTKKGLIVYLPPDFDDQKNCGQNSYKCFRSSQDNFEWFPVKIAGRS
jgi:hypothetical protein